MSWIVATRAVAVVVATSVIAGVAVVATRVATSVFAVVVVLNVVVREPAPCSESAALV